MCRKSQKEARYLAVLVSLCHAILTKSFDTKNVAIKNRSKIDEFLGVVAGLLTIQN